MDSQEGLPRNFAEILASKEATLHGKVARLLHFPKAREDARAQKSALRTVLTRKIETPVQGLAHLKAGCHRVAHSGREYPACHRKGNSLRVPECHRMAEGRGRDFPQEDNFLPVPE